MVPFAKFALQSPDHAAAIPVTCLDHYFSGRFRRPVVGSQGPECKPRTVRCPSSLSGVSAPRKRSRTSPAMLQLRRPGPSEPARLQAHIDDCDGCRLVLAEAARATNDTAPASGAPFRTLADGQHLLGRYEIRRFIARGGMGEVYEAFDSVLGERVALKTLLATSLDDQRAIERLADEVRLARKVTHAECLPHPRVRRLPPAGRTERRHSVPDDGVPDRRGAVPADRRGAAGWHRQRSSSC